MPLIHIPSQRQETQLFSQGKNSTEIFPQKFFHRNFSTEISPQKFLHRNFSTDFNFCGESFLWRIISVEKNSVEKFLWNKFCGNNSVEKFLWKNFCGKYNSVENANLWKMQFCGKCNSVENAILWKMQICEKSFQWKSGTKDKFG